MTRISRGAPAKGCPPKGSWGDSYVIENTYESKRVSCSSCIHYREDDKSCDARPIYVPENGYGYWKNCKYFDLSPKLSDDFFSKEVVRRVKGSHYTPQKPPKKQKHLTQGDIGSKKIFSSTLNQKELHKLALQCPHFNKYNNHCKMKNEAQYCSVIRNVGNNGCIMQRKKGGENIVISGTTDISQKRKMNIREYLKYDLEAAMLTRK